MGRAGETISSIILAPSQVHYTSKGKVEAEYDPLSIILATVKGVCYPREIKLSVPSINGNVTGKIY